MVRLVATRRGKGNAAAHQKDRSHALQLLWQCHRQVGRRWLFGFQLVDFDQCGFKLSLVGSVRVDTTHRKVAAVFSLTNVGDD